MLPDSFYFARHGETAYNAVGVVTGALDIPLNQTGVRQAVDAASLVRTLNIASCIASPLKRAIHTAELMLEGTGVSVTPVEDLFERHWGELEGTSKEKLDNYVFSEMNVEQWDSFVKRTINALQSLTFTSPVLIVAHSGTYRALCEHLHIHLAKKPVKNAWPYKFYKTGDIWQVELL